MANGKFEFIGSFTAIHELPRLDKPAIAFLGRSNVGKSSLINLVTGSKIARVSKTPGRTQALNLFRVEDRWIFGDFPGYGYAKVSKAQKKEFERLVRKFLTSRNFGFAIQISDARHPGMETDLMLNDWLNTQQIPHAIVLNKSDKLNQKERVEAARKGTESFPDQPLLFVSSVTKEGKKELLNLLVNLNGRK